MKLTSKVKLCPTPEQASLLLATLEKANRCANWISRIAWIQGIFGTFALHHLVYKKARQKFPLSAQMVIRAVGRVADAYKGGHSGQPRFAARGAVPYDDRILSWNLTAHTVSLWTLAGRQTIPFQAGPRQGLLLGRRAGESDLIYQRGKFYLAATCAVEPPETKATEDVVGVDLGVVQIGADSDGNAYSGATVNHIRHRHRRLRRRLQKVGTPSARRKLKRLSGKEHRFAADTNHRIAKEIVELARRTKRAVAVENLTGIRQRIRARRDQRAVLHSWAFDQLKQFLLYKAHFAGVTIVLVDPHDSSRQCSQCGHTEKANRPSQSQFLCRHCGYVAHADYNAALNLRERGRARVNWPIVARVASGDFESQLQATGFSW